MQSRAMQNRISSVGEEWSPFWTCPTAKMLEAIQEHQGCESPSPSHTSFTLWEPWVLKSPFWTCSLKMMEAIQERQGRESPALSSPFWTCPKRN